MGSCRILLLVSLIWTSAYSKSISSNRDESLRKSRQLDFGECCPCPKPEDVINDQKASTNVMSSFDDCPCRNRASDTETASSLLTPALQALRPLLRPDATKSEPDPLLKPEVGLASSVLETLQEVTNEEYQNALARDAARSVVKALETDLMESVDSPGNIINIILNPKDKGNDFEVLPEASHIQETRCIHSPLGGTSNYKTNNLKSSFYIEPKRRLQSLEKKSITDRNHFDMDNEASNVQNFMQKPSNGYTLKSLYEKQDQNELTEESKNDNTLLTNDNRGNSIIDDSGLRAPRKLLPKVPDLKLATLVDNLKKSIQSTSMLNQITNKNIPSLVRNKKPNISTSLPEKVNPELTDTFKPILFNNNFKKPMKLRNILKLKDVELIPIQNTNKNDPIQQKDNGDTQNISVCEEDKSNDEKSHLNTDVLDAEPSASNVKVINIESQSSDVVTMKNGLNHSDDVNFTTVPSIISTSSEINLNQNLQNDQDELSHDTNKGVSDTYFAENEDYTPSPSGLKTYSEKNDNVSFEETTDPCIVSKPLIEEKDASNFIRNEESTKKYKNTLPLIRADILKSFENFKKVNDNMQEKLRQNLRNVLQLVDKEDRQLTDDENHEKYMRTSMENTSISNTKDNIIEDKNITLDDLKKMSDLILHSDNTRNNELEKDSNEKMQDNDSIKPVDCVESRSDAQKDEIANNSAELVKNEDVPSDDLESSTIRGIIITDKSKEDTCMGEFGLIKTVRDDRQNSDLLNLNKKSSNEDKVDMDYKDLHTGMSENIESITNHMHLPDPNNTFVSNQPLASHNEKGCVERNLNEMSVQASEHVANRALQPDFGRQKTDRNLNSKYSLSSSLKPYSARVSSPDFLNRDYLHQNLANKINSLQSNSNKQNNDRNNNLQSIFKKTDKAANIPTGKKHSDILVSDPSDTLGLISNNYKSRRKESLQKLNQALGMGKNTDRIKSNGLFEDVLSNAEDFRRSFSQAHNDLSDRLQELHTDWNNKIQSINKHANNLDRTKLSTNSAANTKTNSIIKSHMKIPESKLKQRIPTTLTNGLTKGKPLNLQNSFNPLNENVFLVGKEKISKSILTTTMRPFSILSTKIPQMKGILNSPPKPTLSQTIKNALESAPSNRLKMKIKDLKTLPSTIDTVTSKNLNNVPRLSNPESQETIEMENASLENKNNILRTNPNKKSSLANNINTPFQLKADESSLLHKLLEGIRSSQIKSDTNIMKDNHVQDESLQSPSQNIQQIQMPGNTLRENISYKCKMVCSKDDK